MFDTSVSCYPELLRCLDQAHIERKDFVSTLVVGDRQVEPISSAEAGFVVFQKLDSELVVRCAW